MTVLVLFQTPSTHDLIFLPHCLGVFALPQQRRVEPSRTFFSRQSWKPTLDLSALFSTQLITLKTGLNSSKFKFLDEI